MHTFSNKLINETSPYLLQHAHNPVNWYPWGDEALDRAKKEDKPVLVSIGYSSCHWCHVMERESFEDEEIASLMNEHFINIKIDREERPDLDHIYMDAVQAMAGSGGWPLNVFLTPDRKPFYGGTYFPPRPAYNRPSWQDILLGVSNAYKERKNEIDTQAENLTQHLVQSNTFGLNGPKTEELFRWNNMDEAFSNIMKNADTEWGGFGKAPKFPQTFTITFLLRYSYYKQLESSKASPVGGGLEGAGSSKAPSVGGGLGEAAILSLDKMIDGGIYDQAGGGFARYSTDTEWLVPHFEKMLYDNALLISTISEAYQLTGKQKYREVIAETIGFLQREMMHPGKGFYAALDADSEGVEGKFYVWEANEVKELLKDDAIIFNEFFDITENGNFEHKNILRRKKTEEDFAKEKNISVDELRSVIDSGKRKLLEERKNRIRPQLDDKILLGWNALINTALSKAFAATGEELYRQLAKENMSFLQQNFYSKDKGFFHHTWKNGEAKYPAFLDDYAYLIQSLILLQEITGDTIYLIRAKEITEFVIDQFTESETGFFFYTHKDQHDVIVRKKEVYDGAQPSGNSIMMENLYRLSLYFDKPDWRERSVEVIKSLGQAIIKYPTSFGVWACLSLEITTGTNEIVIAGRDCGKILVKVLREYIPHKILMCTTKESSQFPLLYDKKIGELPLLYLCRNYACEKPVSGIKELMRIIRLNK